MPRNSRLAAAVVALLATFAVLSGCTADDYLNHRDTVALSAGDAVNANMMMETTDPWFKASGSTSGLGSDAGRASAYLNQQGVASGAGQPLLVNGPSTGPSASP